jgi:hypothetical protein
MKKIGTIEGCDVFSGINDSGKLFVEWTAKAAIDTDGSGPLHGDPCAQADTSLHRNGAALNADIDKYIVVPPFIIQAVAPVVMGCQAFVTNQLNGQSTNAVVGDIGPKKKIGELSVATAMALDIDPSPTHGGEDLHVIRYRIYPGIPAVVDGVTYQLKPSK